MNTEETNEFLVDQYTEEQVKKEMKQAMDEFEKKMDKLTAKLPEASKMRKLIRESGFWIAFSDVRYEDYYTYGIKA